MRILTKFDIRNGNVVKGINYEGVEKIGNFMDIYNNTCNYISKNINSCFEVILNDVTASLYDIKSGKNNITNILKNKYASLPHICSGGIVNIDDINNCFDIGSDRIMINTGLHNDINSIKKAIQLYGSQMLIASIETRFVNGDYYVYKSYGRDDTDIKLIDWIKFLLKNDIIEILIISMDKDGTLTGYDKNLLDYLKKFDDILEKHLSILYAGGIENIEDIKQIEQKYSFVKGVSISTLFYRNIKSSFQNNIKNEIQNEIQKYKKKLYFLSYIKGNKNSVQDYFYKKRNCITVKNINSIPINEELCISGHYNSFELLKLIKNNNDFHILKNRLQNNTIKFIGICAGLQILLSTIKNEYDSQVMEGLNIMNNTKITKLDKPNIGFENGKFYCHSYVIQNKDDIFIKEYITDNIKAYQYHPENSC